MARGILAVFALLIVVFAFYQRDPAPSITGAITSMRPAPHRPAPAPSPRQLMNEAIGNVSLKFEWSKTDFGVLLVNFTIANRNDFDVKDVEIRCTHAGPSGTEIDSNTRTIFELFEAKTARKISKFNMGFVHSQAARSGCEITRLVRGEVRPLQKVTPKKASPKEPPGPPLALSPK